MQNFWTVFRQSLGNMLGKPLWLLMVLSVTLTTLPYAHRTMDDLPVAVIDMDHSSVSRELIRQLDAAPKIACVPTTNCLKPNAISPGANCSGSW